ncbi:reverse transcriptase family protein [Emcibacter sp. SYSU 3D8]|uniref:reverse transcriptase family protein n=1 Tax=Emcibacter sp. SYSU 3D8 TaxID=3133969 RepID=UPI0031FE7BCE
MKLAEVLGLTMEQLQRLEAAKENYVRWTDKATGRAIQQPKTRLGGVHRRVTVLLSRIQTPEFLHSAVKGRSYISNARQHNPCHPTVKIDIRKFYQSIRAQAVYHFFADRMHCNPEVAGLLAHFLTVDGHLATGSSVSPILSFFAYEDMLQEMHDLAVLRGCTMTCYVDDIAFSGPNASRRLVYDAINILRRYRLWGHKTKSFKLGQPKVLTGVAITKVGPRLPNRRRDAIAQDFEILRRVALEAERLEVFRRLVGRLYEAAQIDPSWLPKAVHMKDLSRALSKQLARS